MRFCSPACVEAYQYRLEEQTKVKIEHLGFAAAAPPRQAGLHRLYAAVRLSPT